jgi:hypothetical protein
MALRELLDSLGDYTIAVRRLRVTNVTVNGAKLMAAVASEQQQKYDTISQTLRDHESAHGLQSRIAEGYVGLPFYVTAENEAGRIFSRNYTANTFGIPARTLTPQGVQDLQAAAAAQSTPWVHEIVIADRLFPDSSLRDAFPYRSLHPGML